MKRCESSKDFLNSVKKVIQRYGMIQPGDGVVAAVSGGPDSMALMHCLNRLKVEMDFWIVPAHLDHRLRPESGEDADFVREMSRELGMEAQIKSVDVREAAVRRGISLEEAGRNVRYAFFEEVRASTEARVIATAHHLDDAFETFFLRIFRGSSLQGLTGIAPTRGCIVRPLIETSRARIMRFLEEEGIPYRIDSTNLDVTSDRNFVRNRLIPTIEEYFPTFRNPLKRTIGLLGEEQEFVERMARKLYSQTVSFCETGLLMYVPKLRSASRILAWRVILLALYAFSGPEVRWTRSHVRAVWKLLHSDNPSGVVHLAGALVVAREYDRLLVSRRTTGIAVAKNNVQLDGRWSGGLPHFGQGKAVKPSFGSPPDERVEPVRTFGNGYKLLPQPEIVISEPGTLELPGGGHLTLQLIDMKDIFPQDYDGIARAVFDADELPFPLTIRTPRPGDRFKPWGMQGTRKLKKVLIDLKIPRSRRQGLPLLLKDDVILWIPGIRRGDAAPIQHSTRRVLEVSIALPNQAVPRERA